MPIILTVNAGSSSIRFAAFEAAGRPQIGSGGDYLRQQLQDKLVEHKQYIDRYGEDPPEIRNWAWPG